MAFSDPADEVEDIPPDLDESLADLAALFRFYPNTDLRTLRSESQPPT
jgi:hypothetical protein